MYEDVLDGRSLREQFDNAFGDFYASRTLDPFMESLKDDLTAILELAFLAGYEAAGGHPPASL